MFSSFKRSLRVWLTAAAVLVFVIFAVDNRAISRLSLFPLPFEVDAPLFMVALAFLFFGIMIGFSYGIASGAKAKRELKAEKQRGKALENQLEVLRSETSAAQQVLAVAGK